MSEPWIQTLDGHRFFLHEPESSQIDPKTIGVALSQKCRFGGHCQEFYSVAQHSVLVAELCERDDLKLAALLHDAHEVYSGFGDVLSPAKQYLAQVAPAFLAFLKEHEERIDRAIATRFGFDPDLFKHPSIALADRIALATEARDVMGPKPWPWEAMPEPDQFPIIPIGHQNARLSFMAAMKKYRKEVHE